MPFLTYIIQSQSTTQLYIGQTNNLQDRILRHNQNRNKWTKNKGPWKLIFARQFETRAEAVQLERKLKSYKDKLYLLEWISDQDDNIANP